MCLLASQVHMRLLYTMFFLLFICSPALHAQQAEDNIRTAEQYLESRTSSLDKYLNRSQKIHQRLLKKLKRKEAKLLRRLAAKDSALYYQYINNKLSYDSIAAVSNDTSALNRLAQKKSAVIDSLKGIQSFIQDQSSKISGASSLADKANMQVPYANELNSLQQKLSAQQNIDELIRQRTNSLESLTDDKIKGLEGIQKDVYYASEKIKAWKKASEDPDEAEEELMEKLQGIDGFESYLNNNRSAYGGLGSNATAADLEAMGYQLKSSVNKSIGDKLGSNMSAVQQQMAEQISQYSEKLDDITGKVKEAQGYVNDAQQSVAEAKRAKDMFRQAQQPRPLSLSKGKMNPERAKPFKDRLEVNYNFQTSRSSTDGLKPAMLDLGASVAFKHTPNLSYGIGVAVSLGLGKNWQNIRFTYEGVSARAFIDYKIIYGFSLQGGYERIFRPVGRPYLHDPLDPNNNPQQQSSNALKDAFGGQQQAAYIGIMKRYRINSKWSGTFMVGYNFLWQQENMRSPWMLRFGWGK